MFYSHTFLARKGPLGTVWCAAHLQHKLKKSHYTSTNIPSTVERIMFPEVPIALRMSGHLLLGVVRIYSKKVDYLLHDCDALRVRLGSAFCSFDVNLPENASHAQFNAVTLPETYQLDAMDIDVDLSLVDDGTPDNHLKSREEITLPDQDTVGRELYVRIAFEDDVTPMSRSEGSPQRDFAAEIEMPHQGLEPGNFADQDSGAIDERSQRFGDGSSLPDIPDIERIREYHDNDDRIPQQDDFIPHEPNLSSIKITPEKELDTPPIEHTLELQVPTPQSPQRSGPSTVPANDALAASGPFENSALPEMALRPSPIQRPQRKRKQFFDETLVLTNKFVKNALHDCSDLVKKRKKLPCSSLEMWRFRNIKKKEHMFSERVISGLCAELQNLSSEDLIFSQPHLLLSEDAQREPAAAASPPPVPERLRSPDHDYFRPDPIMPSPQQLTPQRSQGTTEIFSSPGDPSSVSEPRFATTVSIGSDHGMLSSSTQWEMETPATNVTEGVEDPNTALSDIPELRNSAEDDELSFLEQDNNSPPDSQGPRDSNTMSVRTRAVAQYLQNHTPRHRYSGGLTQDLSLNSILEGRSRKLCARMFYETLVLKDYGLIDVQQDESYGDIILKLNPSVSATKI